MIFKSMVFFLNETVQEINFLLTQYPPGTTLHYCDKLKWKKKVFFFKRWELQEWDSCSLKLISRVVWFKHAHALDDGWGYR